VKFTISSAGDVTVIYPFIVSPPEDPPAKN
jgi:hypothetical protein